jgi:hypothetical protein
LGASQLHAHGYQEPQQHCFAHTRKRRTKRVNRLPYRNAVAISEEEKYNAQAHI